MASARDFDSDKIIELGSLLYASAPTDLTSGPTNAFQPLSTRKIDAGVTNVINARFNRKPDGPT